MLYSKLILLMLFLKHVTCECEMHGQLVFYLFGVDVLM